MKYCLLRKLVLIAWFLPIPGLTAETAKASSLKPKLAAVAQADKNRAILANKPLELSTNKKKSRSLSYTSFLPFGTGQFARNKTVLGVGFAATQAGFLLIYLDRLQQIKNANRDVNEVMNSSDPNSSRNDPTILSFLDANENFVKKSTQESQTAMLGFVTFYGLSVAEAVFDPFRSRKTTAIKKKPAPSEQRKAFSQTIESRLVMNQSDPDSSISARTTDPMNSGFGVFYKPASSTQTSALGLSFQKPF